MIAGGVPKQVPESGWPRWRYERRGPLKLPALFYEAGGLC